MAVLVRLNALSEWLSRLLWWAFQIDSDYARLFARSQSRITDRDLLELFWLSIRRNMIARLPSIANRLSQYPRGFDYYLWMSWSIG
jgi:hypothetical protein